MVIWTGFAKMKKPLEMSYFLIGFAVLQEIVVLVLSCILFIRYESESVVAFVFLVICGIFEIGLDFYEARFVIKDIFETDQKQIQMDEATKNIVVENIPNIDDNVIVEQ